MHPLDVLCQCLANLRNKAADGRAAKLGEQLPSLQDAILPAPGLIMKDGTGLRRLPEQTCRGAYATCLGAIAASRNSCRLRRLD